MKRFLTLALACLPLVCFSAPTYTSYFNNTHTYTNATVVGTTFAGRGVLTNGGTFGPSTFTDTVTTTDGSILSGDLILTSTPVTVASNSTYNAFPGLAYLPNGNLFGVYRSGSENISTNGVIVSRYSTDGGATWSAESTVYTVGTGNIDVRDPEIVKLSNGTLLLSFFRYNVSSSLPQGVFVIIGTPTGNSVSWGSPISVTSTFTHATVLPACSSKPIQLANGEILLPIYGKNVGDVNYSAAVVKSTDNGATWGSQVTLASSPATQSYTEANGVQLASGRVVIMIRHDAGTVGYARVVSDDNGATWSAVANVITNNVGTVGKPVVTLLPNQKLWLIGRMASPYFTGTAASLDEGATWTPLKTFGGLSNQYNYASTVLITNGASVAVGALIAAQSAITNAISDIHYYEFADGPAVAPNGNAKFARVFGTDLTIYDKSTGSIVNFTNLNGVFASTAGGFGSTTNRQLQLWTGTFLSAQSQATSGVLSIGNNAPTAYPSQRTVFTGNSNPGIVLDYTAGLSNEKLWEMLAVSKNLHFRALDDAASGSNPWLTVTRGTGTAIASVVFPRGMISLGAATSAGVLLTNVGTTVVAKLGDNSADTKFQANDLVLSKTITAAATTGDQTINKASGSVNFEAAAQTITVTDSLVTANSVIMATVATDDATAKSCIAVPGSGSFVLKLNAAATAETRVQFLITN